MQKAIITYLFSMINRTSKIDWLNLLSKKNNANRFLHFIYSNNMQFSPKQMEQLKFALETGLTMSQMLILAKPHFDPYQMEQIRSTKSLLTL